MLRFVVRSIIVVLAVFSPFFGSGQNLQLRHFTEDDGLPSNTVYYVYRDSKNFLWICTDKGVARYNGIRFEKFTTFNGLADNEIFTVTEDHEGRLWFATYNGQLCFFQNDSFHNAANTPFLKLPHRSPRIDRIDIQPDSSVLIKCISPAYFSNIKGNKCAQVIVPELKNTMHVSALIKKTGAFTYEIIGDIVYVIDAHQTPKVIDSQYTGLGFPRTVCNEQGQSYLYFDSGVYTTDLVRVRRVPTTFYRSIVPWAAYQSKEGIWFHCTDHGLFVNDTLQLFGNEKVNSVTQDNKGNYWISTLDNGIYSFSNSFLSANLISNAYQGIIKYSREIGGQLFFSTDDQIIRTLHNKQVVPVLTPPKPQEEKLAGGWFIDSELTAYHFEKSQSRFVSNILSKQPLIKSLPCDFQLIRMSIKQIIKVGSSLYVNTGFSLHEVSLNDFINNKVNPVAWLDKKNERVLTIAASDDNTVWQSTIDSVYCLQNGRNSTVPEFNGIAFKHMEFVGKFLVGCTLDNRLLVCSNLNSTAKIDTIIQESVWNDIYPLDGKHALLTTNGLNYLLTTDPGGKLPPNATAIEDPFIPVRANTVCVGDTNCYFFKNGTITIIPKAQLLKVPAPPELLFTELRSAKHTYPIQTAVELPYYEAANLTIGISTVSFIGKDIGYQYAISESGSGTDRWINFTGDLNLSNRSFGTYTVKVRAKTISSAFSAPIQFQLTILRPFWATWWFITLSALTVALTIWLIARWRIRVSVARGKKEHENHVHFIKSEYKAMNALMNPHFVFNALNNVQSLVNNNETLNATEYLGIFADLIRQNMNNISHDTISLQKEINLVENYLLLEKLRFEDQLNYSIHIADSVFPSDIMVPPLLIQPLVENSIKHGILPLKKYGRQGIVHINIYERGETLLIEVKDNGIGIAKAKEKQSLHTSYGLENLRSRIDQLSIIQGKKISFQLIQDTDADGTNIWTTATITLPLS